MNARRLAISLAALVAPLFAKTPEPVRLLSCVVDETGLLEAEVSNTSGFELTCELRCDYVIREEPITHDFKADIPARYEGRVGRFDTSSGRPGRYRGSVGACRDTLMR